MSDIVCAMCDHPKASHKGGRGKCSCWQNIENGGGPCLCSCYIRLAWDKWQPAKVGTQPAIIRFRVHNNPTKWSAHTNEVVEFQIRDTKEIASGRVTKVNPDGYSFIELF